MQVLQFIQEYYTDNCDEVASKTARPGQVTHAPTDGVEATQAAGDDNASKGNTGSSDGTSPSVHRAGQNLDGLFLAKVWQWLVAHPDITNGDGEKCGKISLDDAKALAKTNVEASARTEASAEDGSAAKPQLRLRATEERIWRALTGHGVDFTSCPRLEFQCLCAIAAHRQAGIPQPDLTRLTGQDKRSLPRRTTELARKGYIEKKLIFYKKQRTSFLRLRKYANSSILPRRPQAAPQADPGESNSVAPAGPPTDEAYEAEPLVRLMFSELKERQVITQMDMKWKLVSLLNASRVFPVP